MDTLFFENKVYLVVKTLCWFSLFAATGVDWLRHRNDLAEGYQLHHAIFGCLSIFVVRDIGLTSYVYTHDDTGITVDVLMKIIYHFAQSAFMILLMVICSGWKTTRATLGKRLRFVVWAPIGSLLSSVVADYYLLKRAQGYVLTPTDNITVEVALATSIFLFLMIWIWIFQAAKVEEATLLAKIAGVSLAGAEDPLTGETLETDIDTADSGPACATTIAGETSALPETQPPTGHGSDREVEPSPIPHSSSGESRNSEQIPPPPMYDEATGEGQQGSLADDDKALIQMPIRAKLRMAVQLKWAITVYTAMRVFKFVYNAFEVQNSVALVIMNDIVLFGLMLFLCWSYRLRKHNPYYMLEDYGEEEEYENEWSDIGIPEDNDDVVDSTGEIHGGPDIEVARFSIGEEM